MAKPSAYITNAIAQLFDEIEDKCHVKFATFTASDTQGQQNIAAAPRSYMNDVENNESNGIYKYLYDPNLNFDFRFHQRLAAAPFQKTRTPWVTIMFNTKQARPLTNVLSHKYTYNVSDGSGNLYELKTRRVSVPVNMALISNDMTKLYETTEKIAMYFDRFINYHYDHVISIGDLSNGGFDVYESVVGHAANIREVDLTKLDTEQRGSLVSEAYQFDLVYWIVETPGTQLHLLKRVILQLDIEGQKSIHVIFDETEGDGFDVKETPESTTSDVEMYVTILNDGTERLNVIPEDDVADIWVDP